MNSCTKEKQQAKSACCFSLSMILIPQKNGPAKTQQDRHTSHLIYFVLLQNKHSHCSIHQNPSIESQHSNCSCTPRRSAHSSIPAVWKGLPQYPAWKAGRTRVQCRHKVPPNGWHARSPHNPYPGSSPSRTALPYRI